MVTRKLYINGSWIVAESDRVIKVENPETHAIIACVPRSGDADVNKAVAAAKAAFETWQFAPLSERLEKMERVLAGMRRNRQRLIDTISAELGCPIKIAAEMHTDPFILETENYIETARSFCYEERRGTSVVRREPVGVVAGLTPWNFPLEQIEKKVVPALLAGCCVVLKPSQYTPLTAYILAELIDEAGYPAGVFNLVTGCGPEVGNALALHPDVRMLSFTGSTAAGREVARLALSNIKRIALHDEKLRALINDADLVLPDGAGVVLASKLLKTPLKQKVAGVDFADRLLSVLEKTGGGLFLLGSKPGIAELAAQKMTGKHPKLRICGMNDGYFKDEAPVIEKINAAKPDVLFVCLGAPKQEIFMKTHLKELHVKLMIGLGGSLDSFAGTVKRAPNWMIRCNLEWLYRLIKEPKRFGRMLRLPKYLFAVLGKRIRG